MISDQNIKKLNKILKKNKILEQRSLYLLEAFRNYSPYQGNVLGYYSEIIHIYEWISNLRLKANKLYITTL